MDIVLRAALAFAFIFFLTRIVGRRELSSLEPFDLILLIVLGDLVQQGVTQSDYSVTGLILAAGTIAVLQTTVTWLGFPSPHKVALAIGGEPIALVQDGKPIGTNLKKERLTEDELYEEARGQNIGSIDQVE